MSLRNALLVMVGGLVAGTANTIAGGGSLLTFPLLVALGLPPLDANVTNPAGAMPTVLVTLASRRRGWAAPSATAANWSVSAAGCSSCCRSPWSAPRPVPRCC